MFAAYPSGRSLWSASDPGRDAPRHVRDHEQLVDLRLERRQRLGQLGGAPVRHDDRRDLHASTSRYTSAVRRARLRPRERLRALDPGGREPVALAESLDGSGGEIAARRVDRCISADLAERGLVGRDDRRAAGHRLDHRQPEPLEPRGQDEQRSAPVEVGEALLGQIAAQVGPAVRELGGEPRVLLGAGHDERQPDRLRGGERGQRILALLDRADEEDVAVMCASRRERGSTPFGVTVTLLSATP